MGTELDAGVLCESGRRQPPKINWTNGARGMNICVFPVLLKALMSASYGRHFAMEISYVAVKKSRGESVLASFPRSDYLRLHQY
jgi:hypothetical protein